MRRLLFLLFMVLIPILSWNFASAQDDTGDLLEPLVSPESEYEDLLEPLVTDDYEDLLEPLVTATAPRTTRTPDPRIQLPTDGMYYKRSGASMEITGQCRRTRYDCNGCGGGSYMEDRDLPQVPICGSAEGILPAVNVEGRPYLYIAPTTNMYGETQTSFMQELDANGQTIGSFRVEMRTDVIVVSATEVRMVTTLTQEGGCTQTYTITYTLASAGEVTCTARDFPTPTLPPVTPTVAVTLTPVEEPSVEPPLPSEPRTVFVIPDEYVDENCNEENTFPPLETVDVSFNDDYTASIKVGEQIYTLYRDGATSYGYDSGGTMAHSYSLSLRVITENAEWSFGWRRADSARNHCWRNMRLVTEKPVPATPTPIPDDTNQGGNGGVSQTISGTYDASWLTQYMPECDAIFDGMIPDDATMNIEFADTTVTVDVGTDSFSLVADEEWYTYYAPTNDGIQLGFMLFADANGDGWFFSWSATSGEKVCVTSAMLTLP